MIRESHSKEVMCKQRSKGKEGFGQECVWVCEGVKDTFQKILMSKSPEEEKILTVLENGKNNNTSLISTICNKNLIKITELAINSLLSTNKQTRIT